MQRAERWDDAEERRPSRRNSASLQDRASSASSTPKRTPRNPHDATHHHSHPPDFMVTGKQIAKRSGRTNSIPGALPRRGLGGASSGAAGGAAGGAARGPHSAPTRARPADYDATLDLSLVSDFEDTSSKYGFQHRFSPLAASSPKRKPQPHQPHKPQPHKPQPHQPQPHRPRGHRSLDSSRQSTLAGSRDISFMSSSSYRPGPEGTDPEYTPGSAEYSAPSSAGSATEVPGTLVSPRSQDCLSSYCVSWQESERDLPCAGGPGGPPGPCCRCGGEWGEWGPFWEDYNRARARGSARRYYDQCPTPYRSEDFDPADLDVSGEGPPRSPEAITLDTSRGEGLRLTGRETRELMRCARFLRDVLSRAAGRAGCGPAGADQLTEIKKTMTLPLKETTIPVERRWETATTQTDISLPNTKSAPRIFEKILRQLSKTSLEVPEKEKEEKEKKEEDREEKEKKEEDREEKEESREISNGT